MMDCKRCGNYSHGGTDGSDLCDLCARSDYNKEILSLRAELSEANAKLCRAKEAWEKRNAALRSGDWDHMKILDSQDEVGKALSSTAPCRHEEYMERLRKASSKTSDLDYVISLEDENKILSEKVNDEIDATRHWREKAIQLREAVEWVLAVALDDTKGFLPSEKREQQAELRRRAFGGERK